VSTLEQAGILIGSVTGVQACRRYGADLFGEETHAGTMLLDAHKDPAATAAEVIAKIGEIARMSPSAPRAVGRLQAYPCPPMS